MPSLSIVLVGLVFLSSLHTPCSAATANGDTLAAGQALAVGDKLISRNGKFALGFFQPGSGNLSKSVYNNTPGWYLGIWFNKIPVCTTVWVANRDKPITDTQIKLAQLKISRDGNLAIVLNNTESMIWSTHTVVNGSTETATNHSIAAVLRNNGNLALGPSNGVPLWQSFDYPTDVGIPGAKLGWNKAAGLKFQFISKKNHIDPGLGSYYLELDTNGLRLGRRNTSFQVWSWPSGKLTDQLVAVLNGLLDSDPRTKGLFKPAYVKNSDEEYFTYTSSNESSSSFAFLDITGQIKLNVWSQAKQSWETIYSQPSDFCTTYAVCGPNTVCNGSPSPFCDCMEGFTQKSPRDWELGDPSGGCVRNTTLDCTASYKRTTRSTDLFLPIARVTLPNHPQNIQHATTQSKCEEACLSSCSCTAYSYNNSRCSVWNVELLDVKQNDGLDNTSEDALYLRLPAKDLLPSLRKNNTKPNVGVVTAASIVGFGLLMLVLLLLIWKNKFKWCGFSSYGNQGSAGGIIAFRYTDLVCATKSFSEKLGGGGFGSVYKGVLSDSKTTIAVKKLDGASQGEKQFRAEVSSVGLIQHLNLVKLIGFCCEGDHRLLVYEHMLNGSLDSHLFNKSNNAAVLSWNTRYQITLGIARGLSYLHQSCHKCIIHCDIKPENILVDASFVPKVADFGLAAFVGRDFSRILTSFRGTAGYIAPEWLSGVPITPKIDVYSFGMVLLEIISGRRNSSAETSHNTSSSSNSSYKHDEYFPMQAISKLHSGDVRSLVDPQLHSDFSLEEAERVCKVACWCIQDSEFDRPTMGEVVRVLEGLREVDMPPMPRFLAAITEQSDATTSM